MRFIRIPPVAPDGSQIGDESQSDYMRVLCADPTIHICCFFISVLPHPPTQNFVTPKQSASAQPPSTSVPSNKDNDRRRSDPGNVFTSRHADADSMPPPRKVRRLSGNTVTAQERDDGEGRTLTPTSSKKGKEKENVSIDTPTTVSGSAQKRLQDYSAFKGRGRYAKDFGS